MTVLCFKKHIMGMDETSRRLMTLKKVELINTIAEKGDMTKKDAEKALSAVLESIEEVLVAGEKIQLVGFGTFEVRERAARVGKNPRTNEEIEIPAAKIPAFKAGKMLKDKVNQ